VQLLHNIELFGSSHNTIQNFSIGNGEKLEIMQDEITTSFEILEK